jgi:hypothetical protein
LKSSYVTPGESTPTGISYTGVDTLWSGDATQKLYVQSGQITSTVKDSENVGSVDTSVMGISTTDWEARLDFAPTTTVLISAALTLTATAETATISLINNPTITPDELTLSLALPAPTIIVPTNVTITPDELTLTLAVPAVSAGADETIVSPSEITMSLAQPVPIVTGVTEDDTPVLDEITMALSLEDPTISTASANFASSLPMMTLSAESFAHLVADMSLPVMSLSATLVNGDVFGLAKTLPMLTLNVVMGKHVANTLPLITLSATLSQSNGASLAKPLPLLTLSATLKATNAISFATSLPMMTLSAAFKVGGLHTFASTLPMMSLSAVLTTGTGAGILVANLPLIILVATGYNSDNLTFSNSLPILTLKAFMTSYENRII